MAPGAIGRCPELKNVAGTWHRHFLGRFEAPLAGQEPIALQSLPLALWALSAHFAQFGQSLSRPHGQFEQGLPILGGETPIFPDHSHRKYYFRAAIFFLTVINVLLYSKYPMALDGYVRCVGKRLSGGL